ncbi:hypothetical protein Trydic_g6871 [Trypoxylus dichotomus]
MCIKFRTPVQYNGVRIVPAKKVSYLGVLLDERGPFGTHGEIATNKAEQKTVSLTRIMPNIKGPSSSKRAILTSLMHIIALYRAPVWYRAFYVKKTVSLVALQVVAAAAPIDLMAFERTYIYNHEQKDKNGVTFDAKNFNRMARQIGNGD